jgi:DNA-binding response OmpR family regulator
MPKIAIIDDDPDIVEAISTLLSSKKYEVVTASHVDTALALVDSEKPDLILLDVMMDEPDDGFYLANKFRQKGIKTPVILLTSVSKALGFNFGAGQTLPIDDFIEKPVAPALLLEKIEEHLVKAGGAK